ncbi:MAG: hypothetical protein JST00_15150 [Deltaproteobacteria bacterium]|nr:hypothetical protein [Deltaproteobacteria bacterium]
MMPSKRLRALSLAAGLGAVGAALLATPTACTSFSSEPDDAGTDVATDGGSSSADGGGDGSPQTSDCRVSCPQPGCLREPFDTPLAGGWEKMNSGDGIIDISGGVFRSQAEAGRAYLYRPLSARTRARLSVAVVVDQKPKDGTSLAKIVDGEGSEVNIQFDGSGVHSCVVIAGTPGPPICTEIRSLPGGRARLTLDANIFEGGDGTVAFGIDCGFPDKLTLAGGLEPPASLEVHLGLEGAGRVSYDDLDLTPVF